MVKIDYSRDSLFTEFGMATVRDRYLLPNEASPQDLYARVARYYGSDAEHAQRLYDYMSLHWFSPATSILSNGGTDRALPVSCFVQSIDDSMEAIEAGWTESAELAKSGGGLGIYMGKIRSIGEKVASRGVTSGLIPWLKIQDSMTLGISQAGVRRGSASVYVPVWHPEIEEFIHLRKAHGGDINRKCINLNHAVVIDDVFMHAVEDGLPYDLRSPKTDEVLKTVDARTLWANILETRLETGEPYILFIDNVNDVLPLHHQQLKLKVETSQLCSEITLPTGKDHLGNHRTAVCCLSSLNLEKYDEWKDNEAVVKDVLRFLDTVLTDFINKAPASMQNAAYSAYKERSVGLGVMGLHGFLQQKGVPIDSAMAKVWNKNIFRKISGQAEAANYELGEELGVCPDWRASELPGYRRFSYCQAIAPTASISTIAGGASPGIDPITANVFTQKTLSGSFVVKNKYLERILEERGHNSEEVWSEITANGGSVQFLSGRNILSDDELEVFKTAFEINQAWVIELGGDRAPFIDQAQSLNLFLRPDVSKEELHNLHFDAWQKGIKSLYYLRSLPASTAENISSVVPKPNVVAGDENRECLACQ